MNFAYAYGATRLVLLVGGLAIKFARLPWFRLICRGFFWLSKGKALQRPRELYGSLHIGILKYVLSGIMANVDEYYFSREFPDLPLAPTLFTFFGLVNIQRRGEAIDASELKECPFQDLATQLEFDLNRPEQFCRIKGKIVLADYGNPLVQKALRRRYARATAFA
ncbi:MAG: hypothetical protein Q7S86_04000 [bacterium]|nr:hypothetical protein [bacterium]